jgi:D-beta-D-heptose 7-phosphate kinase/D-beta-D-heptose 1-phosphate adenosyltransferase
MSALAAARARTLLRRMHGRRVLVLGDVMLDEFIWGRVGRISPEAPVPVVQVIGESFHVGGAGNVARNVRSLGGEAVLVGAVGRDAAADRVRDELAQAGVTEALVACDGGRPTTVKTRIIAHHQQVVRADREADGDLPPAIEKEVLARVAEALPKCQVLVVSDYQKGLVTRRVMTQVLSLAARRRVPVLVDPKVRNFALYRRVALVTPNQHEAEEATGIRIRTDADLIAAGRKIMSRLRCRAVLITRGEMGMSLFESDRRPVHVPTAAREIFDVTGAGDTVIATLALGAATGARLADLARLANFAAGVVVGKVGTATASPEEVLAAVEGA